MDPENITLACFKIYHLHLLISLMNDESYLDKTKTIGIPIDLNYTIM